MEKRMQEMMTEYPAIAAAGTIEWPRELFAIDAETTGLDPRRHGLLEIAAIHLASGRAWHLLIDPRPCEFDDVALAKNGYNTEMLADDSRLPPSAAVYWLAQWCRAQMGGVDGRKAILCGRNPGFDLCFFDEAAEALEPVERQRYDSVFSHALADTHGAVISWAVATGRPVDHRTPLYAALGVAEEATPHRAMRGVIQAYAGMAAVVSRWRQISRLRQALVDLVGEDEPEALRGMLEVLQGLPASDADKRATMAAINLLLEVRP